MKKLSVIAIWVVVSFFAGLSAGCNKPRVIPDDKLRQITKEIFLTNAYTGTRGLDMDSLDIYDPIFRKHGYQLKDFRYTLENFSKRKSSRFSDIITDAYTELNNEYRFYQQRVNVLDTVQTIAGERFKQVVREDSLISVTRFADTSKLTVKVPLEEGKYKITYNVTIDSADLNYGHRSTVAIIDSAGKRSVLNTQWLAREKRQTKDFSFDTRPEYRTMVLNIGGSHNNPVHATPSIRVDSLVIVHYLPLQVALDSITNILIDYKLLIDGKEYDRLAPDSVAVAAGPPWSVEGAGGDAR